MPLLPVITRHDDRTAWNTRAVAATLALVTAAVFLPAVRCGFVNLDDNLYVYENPVVARPISADSIRKACTGTFVANWAPITMLSYQLDAAVFGVRPWGFHLTNVLLHAAATALMFVALARMTGSPGPSAAAALIFGLHPMRVESVAWISERKDVLSVFFLALTLLAYDQFTRRPGLGRYLTVVAMMAASLASKATLVTLPVLLLVCDIWPFGRIAEARMTSWLPRPAGEPPRPAVTLRRAILEKLPFFAVAIAFTWITVLAQGDALDDNRNRPLVGQRLPNAIFATGWYLWRFAVPLNLIPYHPPIDPGKSAIWVAVSAAACLGLVAVAAALVRSRPYLAWGVAWFFVSLLPVSQIVQTGGHGYADRYSYIPHLGLCVAVVWAVADACSGPLPRSVSVTALVGTAALLAGLTVAQIGAWKDSLTLWRHCLAHDQRAALPHYNFACALSDARDKASAEVEFRRTLAIEPMDEDSINALAALLIEQRRFVEAKPLVEAAARSSRKPITLVNEASLALGEGRLDEALAAASKAVATAPDDAFARFTLGKVLTAMDDHVAAITAYREAIRLDPNHVAARNNLATALARSGRQDEAIGVFREVLAIDPESLAALRNLALSLEEAGRTLEAVAAWRTVLTRQPDDRQVAARIKMLEARKTSASEGRVKP